MKYDLYKVAAALLEATSNPDYKRMVTRALRWKAEDDLIAAGTHRRIEDDGPRGKRKSGRRKSQHNSHVWRIPKAERARCGAQTRSGAPCQRLPIEGRKRCRNHGGLSTGPKSAEGRAAIIESNRRRAQSTLP